MNLKKGINIEIIDPRTIVPLDKNAILNSVKKTGRVLIVTEEYPRCNFASELVAIIVDEAFDYLDAPVKRINIMDTPIPFAPVCEKFVLPNKKRIVNAIEQLLQ